MGLFSFLKSTPASIPPDLSFLGADMHSHILPALDDGSPDMESSIRYLKGLINLGYNKFICTPHIISDVHPNTPETIQPKYQLLLDEIKAQQLPIELGFAAEYMVNHEFDDILKKGNLLSFGDIYVLIEMSYMAPSPNMKDAIFELIMQGYKPVLAHPERYNYYHKDTEKIEAFVDAGCLLQVNIPSLTGYYGKGTKEVAEWMLREKMVSFAGTDLHHDKHLEAVGRVAGNTQTVQLLKQANLRNISL